MKIALFAVFAVSIFAVRVFAEGKSIARLHDCYKSNGELVLISNANPDSAAVCSSVQGMKLRSTHPKIIQRMDPSKCVLLSGAMKAAEFKGSAISFTELEYYCGEEHRDTPLKVTCKGNHTTDLPGCLKAKFDLESWKADVLKAKKEAGVESGTGATTNQKGRKDPTPVNKVE